MTSSSPNHRISSPTVFQDLTAWFAPELQAYVNSWVAHGGIVKEIDEADIAFVSDRTKQDRQTCKPMMRILRPEWIVDSITGKAVVSLQRYRRTFPALENWETSSYHCSINEEDDSSRSNVEVNGPQSGMEALKSKSVLSFSPSSVILHQPLTEFQYLSITNSNEVSSNSSSLKIRSGDSPRQSPTTAASPHQLQRAMRDITIATTNAHSSTVDVAVKELDTFLQGDVSSESHDGTPTTQYWGTMDPPLGQKRAQNPSEEEQSSVLISDSLTPQPAPKKRRLPESVLRSKRPPPATRDTQLDEDFFCTDSEEDVKPNIHINVPLQSRPPCANSNFGSEGGKGEGENSTQRKDNSADRAVLTTDAENYLQQLWAKLDVEQRSTLMGTSTQGLGLVDIPNTDISMHRRKKDT